jgi:magnesium-transporting ATPase (P-type)
MQEEIKVGDVIKIKHNEQVPADCVVLKVQND